MLSIRYATRHKNAGQMPDGFAGQSDAMIVVGGKSPGARGAFLNFKKE